MVYAQTIIKSRNQLKSYLLFQNYSPTVILKSMNLKVDHQTGGKWFIHGPKDHKKNQLLSPEYSCWFPYFSMWIWYKELYAKLFYPLLEKNAAEQKHPGGGGGGGINVEKTSHTSHPWKIDKSLYQFSYLCHLNVDIFPR